MHSPTNATPTPTPIQTQTIPQVLAARDVVGIAQTGTGKTAAFALPILQRLAENRIRPRPRACRVLVLSPTRELSAQIVDSFKTYGRYLRPSVALAIGGVNIRPQMRALTNGVDVLVATPGRLLDLIEQRAVMLDQVEHFVLDEADRMLDMGFIHDIRRIVGKLPQKRQTLFFSATMPREIVELANAMLRDPVRVSVTPTATTVEKVDQRIIHVDRAGKSALLAEVLRAETIDRVLVFTRTKHGADKVVRSLAKAGLDAAAIHGNKSQGQRERVLAAFRTGEVRTLIATDIAARGIDVDGISHVVNYDLPNIPESYVHRIGRTARAGADRHRDLVLRRRGTGVPARHREGDPDVDPGHRPTRSAAAAGRMRRRRRTTRKRRGGSKGHSIASGTTAINLTGRSMTAKLMTARRAQGQAASGPQCQRASGPQGGQEPAAQRPSAEVPERPSATPPGSAPQQRRHYCVGRISAAKATPGPSSRRQRCAPSAALATTGLQERTLERTTWPRKNCLNSRAP